MSLLTVRKPKAILFDVICTVTKSSWLEEVVFPFFRKNVLAYLHRNWGNRVLMRDIELLREQSSKDDAKFGTSLKIAPGTENSPEKIRQTVAEYVVHCLETMVNHEAIRIFCFHMLFYGYKTGKLVTSVYSDAAICLASWATKDDITLHCFSSGWDVAMKTILSNTTHSDLSLIIRSFMDTLVGPMGEVGTYKEVLKKLSLPPEEVLFLTHSAIKGLAAHQAGLGVVLVATHREDEVRESESLKKGLDKCKTASGLPFIRIFTELEFTVDAPLASSFVDQAEVRKSIAENVKSASSTSGLPSIQEKNPPSFSKTKSRSYSSIKKNIKTVVKSSQKLNQTPRSKSSKGSGKKGKSLTKAKSGKSQETTKLVGNLLRSTKTATKSLNLISTSKNKSSSAPSKVVLKSVKTNAVSSHEKSNSKKSHS